MSCIMTCICMYCTKSKENNDFDFSTVRVLDVLSAIGLMHAC